MAKPEMVKINLSSIPRIGQRNNNIVDAVKVIRKIIDQHPKGKYIAAVITAFLPEAEKSADIVTRLLNGKAVDVNELPSINISQVKDVANKLMAAQVMDMNIYGIPEAEANRLRDDLSSKLTVIAMGAELNLDDTKDLLARQQPEIYGKIFPATAEPQRKVG